MTKIEKDNAILTLVRRCNSDMKKFSNDMVNEHKRILDGYEALIKPLGVTRIQFMVMIGRYNGVLKDWKEEYC